MPSFKEFVGRHGEVGAQALLEQMARVQGIDIFAKPRSLETIWNEVMFGASITRLAA